MGESLIYYVAAASATAAVGSAVMSNQAQSEQNKAQKRAAQLERANARLQQQKDARQRVAQRRRQRAELIASSFSENTGANSAVTGQAGAIQSDLASNIGASQRDLAARTGQSLVLQRGASRAARYGSLANTFGAISSASGAFISPLAGKSPAPLKTPNTAPVSNVVMM